jgi:drug/metabolite transporter (DMT)-like permease
MRDAPLSARSHVGWKELALLLSIGLFWGLNWPAVRTVLTEIPPFTIRMIAFAAAAVVLLGLARLRGERIRPAPGELGPLIAVALLSIFGFNILAAFGQLNTETSRAAIIAFTMPVWATLLSVAFLGERLTWERAAALLLGMAGLALLLGEDLVSVARSPLGSLLTLAAALSWACGTVLLKRRTWSLPPLAMAGWMVAISAPPSVLGALLIERPWTLPMPSAEILAILGYHILFPMCWCHFAWVTLVAGLPAPVAAIGTLTIPVVGVVSAILLLGEPALVQKFVALALVVGGVALILIVPGLRARRARSDEEATAGGTAPTTPPNGDR